MEKTRLGIPTALMAAVICLLGYYGGYVIAGIMVGYVLLVENNLSLKRMALKVMCLLLAFSLLGTIINLIPSILSLGRSFIYIFDEFIYNDYYSSGFSRFIEFLSSLLSMVKMVLFLLMGILSLFGKELKIPGLDKYFDKLLAKQEA